MQSDTSSNPWHNVRVLIIDDTPTSATTLEGLLLSAGLTHIRAIHSGLAAIGEVARERPDLIFLDIKMPEIDGWLLCEMFSSIERWKDVPVVLQSALVGRVNIKKGLALGAHSYIEKPVTPQDIESVLSTVFRPPLAYPENISNRMHFALKSIVETTQQTFNLVLGNQTQIESVVKLDPASEAKTFDFVGNLSARGAANIEICVGWTRELTTGVCAAFLSSETSYFDDEFLLDGLTEVLNLMFGTTFKDLSPIYPVRLGLPTGQLDATMEFSSLEGTQFRIEYTTRDGWFPMYVSIHENPELSS